MFLSIKSCLKYENIVIINKYPKKNDIRYCIRLNLNLPNIILTIVRKEIIGSIKNLKSIPKGMNSLLNVKKTNKNKMI